MADEDALLWMGLGVSAALGAALIITMLRDAVCWSSRRFDRAFAPLLPLTNEPCNLYFVQAHTANTSTTAGANVVLPVITTSPDTPVELT